MIYELPKRVVSMKIKLERAHKSNFLFLKKGNKKKAYLGVVELLVKF